MTDRPAEIRETHTRLLRCTLEVENSRSWWARRVIREDEHVATIAFEESWFGARSMPRVRELLTNMRLRFDAYPHAMRVLRSWQHMEPSTRALICHWHVQLTDPLYRAFAGRLLVERHEAGHSTVTRDTVTRWVGEQESGRWTTRTRIQAAKQLLATATGAGLVTNSNDPRQLAFPRVSDEALTYLLYLLRGVEFEGTLLENPYLASVGLITPLTEDRMRTLSALQFRRQGDLIDFGWVYPDLEEWAFATVASHEQESA